MSTGTQFEFEERGAQRSGMAAAEEESTSSAPRSDLLERIFAHRVGRVLLAVFFVVLLSAPFVMVHYGWSFHTPMPY
ncbi:MAG: hypothetical protein CVV05_00795 [Gammaproteobacteria bacterium HGW-Gammaproteobacteria-1]|jgi:hypothetical protein|nr:MAG: hypothetical protein CVV05_00795 [Gammaproteobacteria bacterium HGW-Gammaproteobacteria-1]